MKKEISALQPWEIFEFCDGPRFYSCKSKTGQIYIVYWLDETDEEADVWLYTKVSLERYYSLKNSSISIYDSLTKPEDDYSLLITVSNDKSFELEEITSEQFDPEWLPEKDDFLKIVDSKTHLLPDKISDVQEAALSSYRHILDLAIVTANNSYELSASVFGNILARLQGYIYAAACDNTLNIRKVPDSIKDENTLNVTGLFASSFGVRLQSKHSELFPESQCDNNLNSFIHTLNSLSNPELLAENLGNMNLLTRGRFKALLKELVTNELSIKTELANPFGSFESSCVSHINLKYALNNIENGFATNSENVTYKNITLVGVDVNSDFFAIKLADSSIIKGKLSKELEAHAFNVPSQLTVVLEETCKIHETTNQEQWTYVLLEVK
jgi:hypothetical protein